MSRSHKINHTKFLEHIDRATLHRRYIGLPPLDHRGCNRLTCRRDRLQRRIGIAYLFPVRITLRLSASSAYTASYLINVAVFGDELNDTTLHERYTCNGYPHQRLARKLGARLLERALIQYSPIVSTKRAYRTGIPAADWRLVRRLSQSSRSRFAFRRLY